ncbi:hypothetical protein ACFOYY_33335 [Streptosporangium jomthongense]|uniref:Molecular chaperone DnaJ n=1 Tax=Streptosporangium jomthongense TaxID=1193683 RepID=A0ABV8F8W2_9ACTN
MTERGTYVLGIPTAAGGKVVLPFLTGEQAERVRASFADVAQAAAQVKERPMGATRPCGNCEGNGHYYETRETKTAAGGTVVTQVEITCRPCKGSGQVSAKD